MILSEDALKVVPNLIIPEFYQYIGYKVTDTNTPHVTGDRVQTGLLTLDYTNTDEYWVTMYIRPDDWIKSENEEVEPPMYNWDYAINEFK